MTNLQQIKARILENKFHHYASWEAGLTPPIWDTRMLTGKKPKPFQPLPHTVSHEACDRALMGKMRARRFIAHMLDR